MSTTYRRDLTPGSDYPDDETSAENAAYLRCKSVADTITSAALLIIASPLFFLLMILVKATSRGPAIYKQARLGRGGRPFLIYKFRSMVDDCEKLTGPRWSQAGDPRVTPLGRFLRRSHLDELPQLWNVIKGDMSLVGPRPERPEIVAKLELEIPNYCDRLIISPGITGLAQVQLPPDEDVEDVRCKVRYDLLYARVMSPWLDLRIMMATAMKVMGFSFETTRRSIGLPSVESAPMDLSGVASSAGAIGQFQSL